MGDRLMTIGDLKTVSSDVRREIRDEHPILSELNDYLLHDINDTSDHWRSSGWYSPSSLPYCARAMWYQRTGTEQRNCLSPTSLITMGIGTAIHGMLQAWLVGAYGRDLQVEVPCQADDLHLRGSADGLLELSFVRRLLEIKTISAKGFSGLHGKPKPEHAMQTHCYAFTLDTPVITYLYVSKEWPHPILEIPTLFDRAVWSRAVERVERVEGCVSAGSPPPQEISRNCEECKFKWVCEPEM